MVDGKLKFTVMVSTLMDIHLMINLLLLNILRWIMIGT